MPNTIDLKNILSEIDEAQISELRSVLDEFYCQDIAEEYKNLDEKEKILLFDVLSNEQGAAVFVELEKHHIVELLENLSDDQITKFANEMELDDAADILSMLDDKRMLKIFEKIQRPFELKELMSFEPDTCGGIMTPGFISVRADLKIDAALRYTRLKARENDSEILYIYVTKKFGELVGVISLRELFLAKDNETVGSHMSEDIISVKVTDDQEEAAELFSKYRFLSIPVVNENNQLVGIITYDDVVDVIEKETTEDILQSSGINMESASTTNSSKSLILEYLTAYKARTPWLIITLLGQCMAATMISRYDQTIAAIPVAISFMPLLSGLSGNIGNQSTTLVVRGLSTGEVEVGKTRQLLIHELITSLCIGITCSIITYVISYYFYSNSLLSLLISSSLIITMMLAVGFGTLTPILFKKLNLDPATASGPLITTAIDVISFFVYLTLITRFISELV
jgi:magnesium transporter